MAGNGGSPTGGFNGGGNGAGTTGGGGGASDLRTEPASLPGSLASRLIVAGGGGGGGDGGEGETAFAPGVKLAWGESDQTKGAPGTLGNGGAGANGSREAGGGGGGGLYGGDGGDGGESLENRSYTYGEGGAAGSSGFAPMAMNTAWAVDTTGVPSITLSYQETLPAATPPSNQFGVLKPRTASASGVIELSIQLPGPGVVTGTGTTKIGAGLSAAGAKKHARILVYGRGRLVVATAGAAELKIVPSPAARRVLRKIKKLNVSVSVTFTPTGGAQNTKMITATVVSKKRMHR